MNNITEIFARDNVSAKLLFGIALILGVFVGLTVFFSDFMNRDFIMAGTANANGVFFALAVLLVMAWKIAGYYGLDYFILPRLANLWRKEKSI